MANEENLIPNNKRSPSEVRENGKKGGKKSARVRAEKRTIQKMLNDFLKTPCSDSPQFENLAQKLGIETEKSKKELFIIICVMNTMKKGTIDDVAKLIEVLGENTLIEKKKSAIEELARSLFEEE